MDTLDDDDARDEDEAEDDGEPVPNTDPLLESEAEGEVDALVVITVPPETLTPGASVMVESSLSVTLATFVLDALVSNVV